MNGRVCVRRSRACGKANLIVCRRFAINALRHFSQHRMRRLARRAKKEKKNMGGQNLFVLLIASSRIAYAAGPYRNSKTCIEMLAEIQAHGAAAAAGRWFITWGEPSCARAKRGRDLLGLTSRRRDYLGRHYADYRRCGLEP